MKPSSLAVCFLLFGSSGIEALLSTVEAADSRTSGQQLLPSGNSVGSGQEDAATTGDDPLASLKAERFKSSGNAAQGQKQTTKGKGLPAWLEKPPYWLATPPEWGPPPQHIYSSWYAPQTIPQPVFKASKFSQVTNAYASASGALASTQPAFTNTGVMGAGALYPSYYYPYGGGGYGLPPVAPPAQVAPGMGDYPYPYPGAPLPLDVSSAVGYASSTILLETERRQGDNSADGDASEAAGEVDLDRAAEAALRAEEKWQMPASRLLEVLELHHSLVQGKVVAGSQEAADSFRQLADTATSDASSEGRAEAEAEATKGEAEKRQSDGSDELLASLLK